MCVCVHVCLRTIQLHFINTILSAGNLFFLLLFLSSACFFFVEPRLPLSLVPRSAQLIQLCRGQWRLQGQSGIDDPRTNLEQERKAQDEW